MKKINFFKIMFLNLSIMQILFAYNSFSQTFKLTDIVFPAMGDATRALNWVDYNNDGYLDLYMTALYKNNGDGTFTIQKNTNIISAGWGSSDWGDFNNDGNMDLALSGTDGTNFYSTIYKNMSNGTFVDIKANLVKVRGVCEWGDYDNDGLLDIFIYDISASTSKVQSIPQIYKNMGKDSFALQIQTNLPKYFNFSSPTWVDYNNDGNLDIMGASCAIFKNNGINNFELQKDIPTNITNFESSAWGDYNNDGLFDVIISGYGYITSYGYHTLLFKNNGDGSFTNYSLSKFIGITNNNKQAIVWGDYNNDGKAEVLVAGYDGNNDVTTGYIYKGNKFIIDTTTELTGGLGCMALGDYNNDGNIDLIFNRRLTGGSSAYSTQLFINNSITKHKYLEAPLNLKTLVNGNAVTLSWDKTSADTSYQNELTYNLYIGNTPSGCQIVSPCSNISNGFRKIVKYGNTGHLKQWKINNLKDGTYYWGVQCVDNSYSGSKFSTENKFTIGISNIRPLSKDNIKVFPNPAKDLLNLQCPENSEFWIVNMQGSIIIERQLIKGTISVNSLVKGLYILNITSKDFVYSYKFIKE